MNKSLLILIALGVCSCRPTEQPIVTQAQLRQIPAVTLPEMPRKSPVFHLPTSAPSTLPTTRPAAEINLTLSDAREMALENNLDLKIELFNPSIAREGITEQESRFEAAFTTDASYSKTDQPTLQQKNATTQAVIVGTPGTPQTIIAGNKAEVTSVSPGFQIPLHTGGTINLSLPTDRIYSGGSPTYNSQALLNISQPLLRNAGSDVNEHGIRIANYQYKEAQARTKLLIIQTLADVERIYWRLYAARQALVVRKQEYDLAVAQFNRAKHQHDAGVVAEVDVVRGESGVADAVENVIIADNDVIQRERDLKRILNNPDLDVTTKTIVVPATEPRTLYTKVDRATLADKGMRERMEMIELQLQIAEQIDNVSFARNQLLPLLALSYTYGINGLGNSLDDALTMVRQKDFENHTVSLHLEIPIGNEAAKSRLRVSLLQRQQTLASREQRAQLIRQEIYNAADTLDTDWQRIIAARQRVVTAARTLEAETRSFINGIRTSNDVLDAQTRLADAKLSEISALSDYQISQVDIAYATGTLLGESKVRWTPAPVPKN